MFDHVKFRASDYAASKAFFLNALQPPGVAVVSEATPTHGVGLESLGDITTFLDGYFRELLMLHLPKSSE